MWKQFFSRYLGGIKGLFFLIAMGLALALHFYTQEIVKQLRQESRSQIQLYARILSRVAESEDSEDMNLSFIFEEVIQQINFPMILFQKIYLPCNQLHKSLR